MSFFSPGLETRSRTWVLRIRSTDREIIDAIRGGKKTVETRVATERYRRAKAGDRLLFVCGDERLEKTVANVRIVPSVEALAVAYPPESVLPGARSASDLHALYARFPNYLANIATHGIVAFEL